MRAVATRPLAGDRARVWTLKNLRTSRWCVASSDFTCRGMPRSRCHAMQELMGILPVSRAYPDPDPDPHPYPLETLTLNMDQTVELTLTPP